ncbi:MAG TPA: hypothetical protein VGE05_06790, partial [Novosphingobium sp.]
GPERPPRDAADGQAGECHTGMDETSGYAPTQGGKAASPSRQRPAPQGRPASAPHLRAVPDSHA